MMVYTVLLFMYVYTLYISVYILITVYMHMLLCYSSIMLWIAGVLVGASVKMVPTKVYGPHSGWEMHLQHPRSRISNPKYRNRSSVSNSVACEYGL